MKKITILFLLVFLLTPLAFGAAKKPAAKPKAQTVAATESKMTISPKFSYVGYLGIGAEFAPLYKISDDIDLMAEANWDFASWTGTSGYFYGEVNGVYKAKPIAQGDKTLNPYVGGGLIYGFPMGSPNTGLGGSFGGGIGYGIFGGVTTQMDPYTVYAQLKYAYAPITYSWPAGTFWPSGSSSANALGIGMEFGVRF